MAQQSAVAFQLSPASLDTSVIDYSTKEDLRKFERATKALNNVFDGTSGGMTVFKGDLKQHANNSGWDNGQPDSDVISIPGAVATEKFNIITQYSQLTRNQIISWATSNVINKQTRKAQNNANMYQCIYNSISTDLLNQMLLEESRYMVQETPIAALFYKELMNHASVDTQATISLTRQQLASLDVKMVELNSDVSEFNKYVSELKLKLAQHGTKSDDLLINLFRGYKAARDNNFNKFILDLERDYLYGEKDLSADELMSKALTAFQVEKDRDTWGALTEDQQMIVAMQAQIKSLKDTNPKLDVKKDGKKRKKKVKKEKEGIGRKDDEKKSSKDKKKHAWKLVPPKNNEKSKKENGKTYHWCTNHNDGKGMWVLHTPAECRLKKEKKPGDDRTSYDDAAAAAMATLDQASDEE